MLVLERALKHQDLLAAPMLMRQEFGARCPAHKRRAFCAMTVQRKDGEARNLARQKLSACRVDHLLLSIGVVKLVQFYEDRAAMF